MSLPQDTDFDKLLEDSPLTQREILIAKYAAQLAVRDLETRFYSQIGKGLVTKVFVWIGIAVVAFVGGRWGLPDIPK